MIRDTARFDYYILKNSATHFAKQIIGTTTFSIKPFLERRTASCEQSLETFADGFFFFNHHQEHFKRLYILYISLHKWAVLRD